MRLLLRESISAMVDAAGEGEERDTLRAEFDRFDEALGDFQFALSRPYFTIPEKQEAGSGGLLSITINPYTCKGCMECVAVCDDDALRPVTQSKETIESLRDQWDLWEHLPNTPSRYVRIDDLDQGIGVLDTLLLDKDAYGALSSGDGACLGCSEKTALHLFTATMEALMQPRVKRQVEYLESLIGRLEQHLQQRLLAGVHVDDSGAIARVLADSEGSDLRLADLAQKMNGDGEPIDQKWLRRVSQLIAELKGLRDCYTQGTTGRGRASMGMLNATGCTSVWGSTYPFNPYPFPWANHLFQDTASIALGVFEGHMAKMARGFADIRHAELELAGEYRDTEHAEFLRRFNWEQFSDEEFLLCPPVVAVGGDGAMYDIGFQNLSRALMSGKPVKVLVVDTQVYSNTGGQACTSGFFGQVSDMAQYGAAIKGKAEARKEIGLIAMAHRTTYVLQSGTAHANHMIEGFIEGLNSRRPALFNIYTPCQPEHGIGDDMGYQQAKLAVESRAYPLFSFDPDRGATPAECFNLEGNPALYDNWPVYELEHNDGGRQRKLELPLTFADFAMSEARFRKHFRMAAPDTWHDDMLPLIDYLALDEDEREGKYPFIWSVDKRQRLTRLLVGQPIVHSCEERLEFWVMLKAIAGVEAPRPVTGDADDEQRVRREVVSRIAQGLMQWASGEGELPSLELPDAAAPAASTEVDDGAAAAADGDYLAPWIETDECTACDECININNAMFVYNDAGKAVIKDANAGSYQDLVKAAEKCTAQVIHPGLPRDRSEADIDRWIARGEKYN